MTKYTYLFLLLSSCSREITKSGQALLNDIPVDQGLKPLMSEFVSYCQHFNSGLCSTELPELTSVKYVSSFSNNPAGNILGRTYFYTNGSRRIEIIDSLDTTHYSLETLVFHECGHALLNRVHDYAFSLTVMDPYLLPASYYVPNRVTLITDEFQRAKPLVLSLIDLSVPPDTETYIDN